MQSYNNVAQLRHFRGTFFHAQRRSGAIMRAADAAEA
jgi:hypothetical protein